MKDYSDLINKIQDYYKESKDQVYTEFMIKEIRLYLIDRKYPIAALPNLYKALTESYNDIPDKSKYRIVINRFFGSGQIKSEVPERPKDISEKTYRKFPQYQLDLAKDWPIQKILNRVNFLRKKQEQLWRDGLATIDMETEELSFLSVWDCLRYIKPEELETARNRIVKFYPDVNLNDLEIDFKPTRIEFERKKETIKIDEIIEEAF